MKTIRDILFFIFAIPMCLLGFYVYFGGPTLVAHQLASLLGTRNNLLTEDCKNRGGTPVYYQDDGNYTGCKK